MTYFLKRSRILAFAVAASIMTVVTSSSQATDYPNKPVRLIVPYVAGGATDVTARLFADRLSATLRQPVVVENKTGGGVVTGTETVAKADPDGYTLLFLTLAHDETLEQRVTRVGRPLDIQKLRIVDPESLVDLPEGERGEILVGGAIFSGYYKDPEQTRKVLLADGWLRTGDAGWVDADGLLVFAGRIKDMLKIGGENVAAVEIESFLARHPKVKMAQVISVPDDRLVEVAAAFVELKSGEAMTEVELIEHCAGQIASYKIPRYVRFVTEWPMSTTKIQKFKLVDGFVAEGKIDVASFLRKASKVA